MELKLKPKRIARAYPELRCTFGGRSTVPDVTVFVWDRLPRDENGEIANSFEIAPDWTIEILSPDQSPTRVIKNILHCLEQGTQLGWMIDLYEKIVFVYHADRPTQFFDVAEQQIPVPDFANEFRLTVGEVFGWLSD